MSTLDDIRQTFFQECDDLLEALDDGLQELTTALEDEDSIDTETVNAVFRAVHSIKGGAAAFGLEALVRFAHQFETTLDELRSSRLTLTMDVMQVCLRAADQLANLVSAGRTGQELPPDTSQQIAERLEALTGTTPVKREVVVEVEAADESLEYAPVALSFDFSDSDAADDFTQTYDIVFTPGPKLFQNGHDPVHLFRELSQLGTLTVETDTSGIPALEDFNPEVCYLKWRLELTTTEPESSIWEIFEFVQGLCDIEISRRDVAEEPVPQVDASPSVSVPEVPFKTAGDTDPAASLSDLSGPKTDRQSGGGTKATVRVDLDHVDRLINVVGELVINQAVLTQCIHAANIPPTSALTASLDEFMVLAREIQEGVMSIRAQSVKPLFQRMARIARESGGIAEKNVRFVTEGETTEVDKTVIERLVDPLTHIIRNSVDHGIETAEKRIAAGKPEYGTITLRAAHRSGRVLIDVADDGGGINRERVFSIAVAKGLVDADANLSDSEIDKLLFLPGFSTAAKVTDLSGRGVGMDVVRSSIQKLGGRISIASVPGQGTTMSISLPLTLAVLDGMVVDVAGQTMVVPITTIVETIRPKRADVHPMNGGVHVVAVRNKFIPIIDLGLIFGFRNTRQEPEQMVFLLVESDHEKMWALAVDRIHDQRQVVIKGIENNYGHIPGIAAATILGDGKVALIVDPEEAAQRKPQDPMPEFMAVKEGV